MDNPYNRTINTKTPPQTGVVGVDIDEFDITAALTSGDTSIETTYSAGADKVWVVANVVGMDSSPDISASKGSALEVDADGNGVVSVGDTVRYTITLDNTGTSDGFVTVTDPIPAEALSWNLVDAAGGTDRTDARPNY